MEFVIGGILYFIIGIFIRLFWIIGALMLPRQPAQAICGWPARAACA